jgi:hypothetical protein
LEEEMRRNRQQSKEEHYSLWRYLVALFSAIIMQHSEEGEDKGGR